MGYKFLSDAFSELWDIRRQNRECSVATTERGAGEPFPQGIGVKSLQVFRPVLQMIVLSVGQENYGDTPEKIVDGIQAICSLIRSKQPQAFLIVLTLLPRGTPDSPLRTRNTRVNEMMVEYVKGNSRLQLVNIDTGFVQVDGTISHHDMFDYLSLTQKGYSKAFDPVNELLTQLLQEMEGEVGRTEAEGSAD